MSFQLPPGLAQPPSSQACPYEVSDLAWQQPALHQPHELQPIAFHPPVVQQPLSATTALIEQVIVTTSREQPSEEQASQQQRVTRVKPKGSEEIANKLQSILEKARSFQEIELAVNTSEEDSRESQAAMKAAQLNASFEDDLSLFNFSTEEITKAKQNAGESLRGTYEPVPRASFTAQGLQHVIQTTWAIQEQSSQDGASLKARILDQSFQQRIFDLDMATCASTTSHMSLKILLTLSLINSWDVITANMSSALLQAPIAIEELVLVQPPPELEQDQDMLWKLTRDVYGIKPNPKLWQQSLASKLEELGLKKNTVDPCIFAIEQLIVMIHLECFVDCGR